MCDSSFSLEKFILMHSNILFPTKCWTAGQIEPRYFQWDGTVMPNKTK